MKCTSFIPIDCISVDTFLQKRQYCSCKNYFWEWSSKCYFTTFHYVKALNRKYNITFSFGYKKISQSGQIQSPNATFIMICFHLPLACQDLYSIVCFVQIEWQTLKVKATTLLQKIMAALACIHQYLNFVYFVEIATYTVNDTCMLPQSTPNHFAECLIPKI